MTHPTNAALGATSRAASYEPTGGKPGQGSTWFEYDDAPLRRFHILLAFSCIGGVFSDGYELGLVGISLETAAPALGLSALWLGLIGAASLAGLFFGALVTGPIADRFGRRLIFRYNMLLIAALSLAQFFVSEAWELLALRLGLGFLLGTDYVVSKALLMEFSSRQIRGKMLGLLAVAWAAGYATAYLVGLMLSSTGPEAWRYVLVTGVTPAFLILPLRMMVPESPPWLVQQGRSIEARAIVDRSLGPDIALPQPLASEAASGSEFRELLSPRWRVRALVGATFFTCQVIPYFALGTFVSRVMGALGIAQAGMGGLAYNVFLLVGAVLGWLIVDTMPRRVFLIGSFVVAAIPLSILMFESGMPSAAIVTLFSVVACALSAMSTLCYVYLVELFPTHLRASGVGLSIAASRIGSAIGTFLLPSVVAHFGIGAALGSCVAVLLIGAAVCAVFAPETRHVGVNANA
jgi:putative MFS transporter